MKINNLPSLLICVFSIYFLASCKPIKQIAIKHTENQTCDSNLICTDVFAFIEVVVLFNIANRPDSFALNKVNSNKNILSYQEKIELSTATHTFIQLASDADLKNYSTTGDSVFLSAYKNKKALLQEPFVIRHDCCHVQKVSGKDTIYIR